MQNLSRRRAKQKALIVCSESPYPTVVGGYERLIEDYQQHFFTDYDVYFLDCRRDRLNKLHHYGAPVNNGQARRRILAEDFAFALFVHSDFDFNGQTLISPLIRRIPSFFFTQYHPNPEVEDGRFRGIITHHSARPHKDVLRIGGSYDPKVFFKNRQSEEFIICVARIHSVKNQLELVSEYRERIYEKHRIPLLLVGGCSDPKYYQEVSKYFDGVAVISTSDPTHPKATTNWRTSREIAALCNRARMFVMPSKQESFSIALIEALACGTTCVVNGSYDGFEATDLRPHVYGNITGPNGSIHDLIDEVLTNDIRIDGSEWVKKYSIAKMRRRLVPFIQKRL